ncbi:MAG: YciK family oxidoreductase [Pseudomonadales bacterium]|nr:YciK family oxidoreductase [Pseudomonadales bacterium]
MFDYQAPAHSLQDRIILITGAGAGIGRALAHACARQGATTILLGRTVANLEQVYDEIEAIGGPRPAIFPLDLETAQEQDYQQLLQGIENEFGVLHGLVHNAGILGPRVPLQVYPLDAWKQVMQINLNAAFALTRQLLPLLQTADNASVVFTSSGVGRKVRAFWGAYAVSKAATEALMQVFHQELEQTSAIRINTVNPGACATAMRKKAYPAENPATLPQPEDIMAVYLYLLGRDSLGESGQAFDAQ